MTSVLIRYRGRRVAHSCIRAGGDLGAEGGRRPRKPGYAKDGWGPPAATGAPDAFSRRAFRRKTPADTLISGFLLPEPGESQFLWFKAPKLVAVCCSSPGELLERRRFRAMERPS